jgi:ABC-2 type transport system permease protein
MTFIAPGLIAMGMIQAAYGHVVFAFFSAKYQRSIEEFIIAPVHETTIISGYVVAGMLRSWIVGGLLTSMALIFTPLAFAHAFKLIITLLLTTSALALAGFFNALFAKKFDDVSVVGDFILTPLTYFAGVFYSVDRLSPSLEFISRFNPLLYIVQSVRAAMVGVGEVSWALTVGVLISLNIFLFCLDWFMLKKRIGLTYG